LCENFQRKKCANVDGHLQGELQVNVHISDAIVCQACQSVSRQPEVDSWLFSLTMSSLQ